MSPVYGVGGIYAMVSKISDLQVFYRPETDTENILSLEEMLFPVEHYFFL